jgi:glycosyltransferase involved in cell wall biosynthesis
VTFVVTSYNYGRFLATALDSLLRQTVREVEVIAIDDASTDETRQVLQHYRNDPRVRVVLHDSNMGHIASYNEGFAQARGRFVGHLSADDYALVPNAVEQQIRMFDSDSRVGLVYSAHTVFQQDAAPWHVVPWPADLIHPGFNEFRQLMWGNYILHSGALLRREVAEELGPYRPELTHTGDWDRWLRAAARHWVGYISQPLYAYRLHSRNMYQTAMAPWQETDQTIVTIERAFASLPPDAPADLVSARPAVVRHGMLQIPWFDLHTGMRRRTWLGLIYATRRRPDLVLGGEFWRFVPRLVLMSMVGRERYRRAMAWLRLRRESSHQVTPAT